MSELELRESNRGLFQMKALGAHARGDWEAERKTLDAIHLLDIAAKNKGTEVSLTGKSGRYRFRYANKTSDGSDVLTFVGGPLHGQGERFTSVYPSRVKTVHRASKTLVNIQKEKSSGTNTHRRAG